jgi:hypothetical protein
MLNDLIPVTAKSRPRWLLTAAAFAAVALATGCSTGSASSTTLPASAATATPAAAATAEAATKTGFPPASLTAFRAFAATGDASKVHKIAASSKGAASCRERNIYVTVSPAVSGRALEADLAAFFVHSGLIKDKCQAYIFAYHSRSEYRAYRNDGYTAGRVALTVSGSRLNLEVDTGEVTSYTYDQQTKFDFSF